MPAALTEAGRYSGVPPVVPPDFPAGTSGVPPVVPAVFRAGAATAHGSSTPALSLVA